MIYSIHPTNPRNISNASGHKGVDSQGNILVLCPNHQVELDYGLLSIEPDELTISHINPSASINGEKLSVRPEHTLDKENLRYHWQHLYKGALG